MKTIEDRQFHGLVDAARRGFRHQSHHAVERPAGIIGKLRGKILIFEVEDGAPQRLLLGWLERRQKLGAGRGHDH